MLVQSIGRYKKRIGFSSVKRHVTFNPAESETYKALQEESLGEHVHEVNPAQSKVYVPNKTIPAKVNDNC